MAVELCSEQLLLATTMGDLFVWHPLPLHSKLNKNGSWRSWMKYSQHPSYSLNLATTNYHLFRSLRIPLCRISFLRNVEQRIWLQNGFEWSFWILLPCISKIAMSLRGDRRQWLRTENIICRSILLCIIKYYLYQCYANLGIELARFYYTDTPYFLESFSLLAESTNIR